MPIASEIFAEHCKKFQSSHKAFLAVSDINIRGQQNTFYLILGIFIGVKSLGRSFSLQGVNVIEKNWWWIFEKDNNLRLTMKLNEGNPTTVFYVKLDFCT